MTPAGTYVSSDDVHELAALVDEPTATVLERALEPRTLVMARTILRRARSARYPLSNRDG